MIISLSQLSLSSYRDPLLNLISVIALHGSCKCLFPSWTSPSAPSLTLSHSLTHSLTHTMSLTVSYSDCDYMVIWKYMSLSPIPMIYISVQLRFPVCNAFIFFNLDTYSLQFYELTSVYLAVLHGRSSYHCSTPRHADIQ